MTQDYPPTHRRQSSLATRALGLIWRNPAMLPSLVREAYRKKIGIPVDRRLRDGRSGPPVNFSLNLTRRCNLKCRMCEQHRRDPGTAATLSWFDPRQELPLAAWASLLDQIAPFRPHLYLTGGEPLMYRHFQELVLEAKKRHLLIHLQTNGILLTKVADFLVDQGVELITVSLDGPPEVHDGIRGLRGAFDQTRAGLAALQAARRRRRRPNPILRLNCVISKASLATLEQMVPLALELGADVLQLQHTMFNSAPNVERHNRWLSPQFARERDLELVAPSIPEGEFYQSEIAAADLPELLHGLREARRQAEGHLRLMISPNLPDKLVAPYYLDLDYPFRPVCHSLWKGCRILPDGTVSPCLHLVAGNIARQSFGEIWNGATMRGFRRIIRRRLLPGCARCCSRSFA